MEPSLGEFFGLAWAAQQVGDLCRAMRPPLRQKYSCRFVFIFGSPAPAARLIFACAAPPPRHTIRLLSSPETSIMKTKALVTFTLALFTAMEAAQAKPCWVLIGYNESIHELTPIKLKGSHGESLVLAFKTTTFYLGLGVYLSDDGYVLAVAGNSDVYFRLPGNYAVQQRRGLLPTPLPPYRVPIYKYLVGFSLWWILGVAGLQRLLGIILAPRRPNGLLEPVPDEESTPPTSPPQKRRL
jgi:hypothetical protein